MTNFTCSKAHPRACGENRFFVPSNRFSLGSSPRVRGKPGEIHKGVRKTGLIPARAGKTGPTHSPRSGSEAHPRACGENVVQATHAQADAGSSPRVRGKPGKAAVQGRGRRLIPARAGKTSKQRSFPACARAHPRACGENCQAWARRRFARGSSPRVRGKQLRVPDGELGRGLIPARAGKTLTPSTPRSPSSAHPRACGENAAVRQLSGATAGSSPRVRGKRPGLQRHPARRRLIPARAGKTPSAHIDHWRARAHPRACGENWLLSIAPIPVSGSSPRVRGKRICQTHCVQHHRLIPARAGKTRVDRSSSKPGRAHPRACGENVGHHGEAQGAAGSSPRVRGKPVQPHACRIPQRLIPARAGKTPACPRAAPGRGAHPRACGENGSWGKRGTPRGGSSPRVRGKRPSIAQRPRTERLIPARAGKTTRLGAWKHEGEAHPRACGENRAPGHWITDEEGSSPRVRGKLAHYSVPSDMSRLIPARAGKTHPRGYPSDPLGAHPRACGENPPGLKPGIVSRGSSPRVRGKPRSRIMNECLTRLIPARAGKTSIT